MKHKFEITIAGSKLQKMPFPMNAQLNFSSSQIMAADLPLSVLIPPTPPPFYRQIKLALDVHAGDLRVVPWVDGAKPQPKRLHRRVVFVSNIQSFSTALVVPVD